MAEPSDLHTQDVPAGDLQLRLSLPQRVDQQTGQVAHSATHIQIYSIHCVSGDGFSSLSSVLCSCLSLLPDGVLEAVVRGARKHLVGTAQLLDVAQPLELGRVDDGHQQRVELHVAVDRVVEHLGAPGGRETHDHHRLYSN